ncbi:ADP-ribosylation factor-like 2 [Cryptococcus deuterogattii 99/473]|uniref:ADP-ribosylation factor-like protein 2 n=2 Tax=Cryptococcus deuterogattii TaxID=1859096 RepID=A0A0D0V158_9TREE|nr:ADP-ribosylation factor-like 2 [Cryptococcus deuterogattii LA55]KIR31395.1 ADP-ribosylation factor-like 2 [Cryptococcus deuterogattii MMRL2647]KIR38640.1 ADP-ribosylation factor-like 2 [Cryptococcus deuterogattii Ram5]KIR70825.1 ADP-ribosylation factor-like 2 [Cryptococcus deuterogattii CA1014]KIR90436.1 ADP-ribosylation factor-like 2 [Cryptococcus deuterogattii CBS 10090]KIY54445.1 ADP-ribosylation factor-like 2 [Cryptococcus deuterogattii 99/473]
MGLLTIVRKNKAKSKEMRVLFLGLDNAGKTTILKKLNNESTSDISPTLGFNIKSLIRDGYTLNIWDVGGQRTLRPYWTNYFESTDAVVWVVDSSDRMRMNDCRNELKELLHEERLAGATLLVFANKQDLAGSMPLEEIRDTLELQSIISHRWIVYPCSAFTGENLNDGMNWLVKEVAKRLYWSGLSANEAELFQEIADDRTSTT